MPKRRFSETDMFLQQSEHDSEPKQHRYVKRGAVRNIWRRGRLYAGFSTMLDGPEDGPWHLRLECTPVLWLGMAWQTLIEESPQLVGTVLDFLGTDNFDTAYARATAEDIAAMHELAGRLDELLVDPAHVPELAILEIYVDAVELQRFHIKVSELQLETWYALACLPYQGAPSPEVGLLWEARLDDPETPDPLAYTALWLMRLPERSSSDSPALSQAVMHMLHYPHILPPDEMDVD